MILKIDKSLKAFFILLAFFLILIPKFNLVSIGGYSGAALRLDDFFLLISFIILFIAICFNRHEISRIELFFFMFILFGLISIVVNKTLERGSVLFVFRMLEYFVFFYIGTFFNAKRLSILLSIFISLNVSVIIFQYFGVVGVLKDGVYAFGHGHPSGLTNGSYEISMALVFALIGKLLVHEAKDSTLFKRLDFWFFLCSIGILLTSSRTPLVLVIVSYFIYCLLLKRFKLYHFLTSTVLVFSLVIVTVNFNHKYEFDSINRFDSLFQTDLVSVFNVLSNIRDGEPEYASGNEITKSQVSLKTGNVKEELHALEINSDLSFMIRVNKWVWATKTFINQPMPFYLLGIAPGSLGNALDGGNLRILIEYGLLGLSFFILFIYNISKRSNVNFILCLSFLIGNMFIDYFMTYKVMSIFYLLVGFSLTYVVNKSNDELNRLRWCT